MRRNLPPTTQRHRSQSISCASPSSLSPSAKSQMSQLQHHLSYDMRSESTNSSPTHGRRESLVKPTWQNIRPGQIPLKTLEKINGITSDSDNEDCEYLRRSSLNYASNGATTTQASTSAAQQQQQQHSAHSHQQHSNVRKHSGSNLGQLTRKGSLVVHRDSLSSNASLRSARSSIDNTSFFSVSGPSTDGKVNKTSTTSSSSGRSLVRMISNKCTTVTSSDEEMDYDFLAKVSEKGKEHGRSSSFFVIFDLYFF
ncbi:hypothetical protein CVS40_11019 [Lucilia cuprina]|nr:hypothetical protein CVS40_11019 [Lucilia cuprina]